MAQVIGVGGVFLRANDLDALRDWYRDALGVPFDLDHANRFESSRSGDFVVLGLFERESTYIGEPSRQRAMVNFVVDDLRRCWGG